MSLNPSLSPNLDLGLGLSLSPSLSLVAAEHQSFGVAQSSLGLGIWGRTVIVARGPDSDRHSGPMVVGSIVVPPMGSGWLFAGIPTELRERVRVRVRTMVIKRPH